MKTAVATVCLTLALTTLPCWAGDVFVNGKYTTGDHQVVFPDVAFTPPKNPATPPGVPVPYPAFGAPQPVEKCDNETRHPAKPEREKKYSKIVTPPPGVASPRTGKTYFEPVKFDLKIEADGEVKYPELPRK